jgi:rubrerythrin
MALEFNADEVFEIAQQIERNGAKFYRRAAEILPEKGLQKVLLGLASMEDHHLEVFTAMREELEADERTPTVFDPDGEAALYLDALANARIFDVTADPSATLGAKSSTGDILRTAIGIEKDSVVFYLGMQDLVPPKLGREQITKIIKEEMGHITILSRELAKLG